MFLVWTLVSYSLIKTWVCPCLTASSNRCSSSSLTLPLSLSFSLPVMDRPCASLSSVSVSKQQTSTHGSGLAERLLKQRLCLVTDSLPFPYCVAAGPDGAACDIDVAAAGGENPAPLCSTLYLQLWHLTLSEEPTSDRGELIQHLKLPPYSKHWGWMALCHHQETSNRSSRQEAQMEDSFNSN